MSGAGVPARGRSRSADDPRRGTGGARYGSAVGRRATTLALGTIAAALLSGCTSEVTGSASPAASTSGPSDEERQETFCDDVPALLQDITAQVEDVQTDPAAASALIEDAVDRMEEVQPPDDVADEWERLVTAWRDLRDLFRQLDPSAPGGNQDLATELLELQPELVDAGTAVDEWGRANC